MKINHARVIQRMTTQMKQSLSRMIKFSFQLKLFLILYFWFRYKGFYCKFVLAIKTTDYLPKFLVLYKTIDSDVQTRK